LVVEGDGMNVAFVPPRNMKILDEGRRCVCWKKKKKKNVFIHCINPFGKTVRGSYSVRVGILPLIVLPFQGRRRSKDFWVL